MAWVSDCFNIRLVIMRVIDLFNAPLIAFAEDLAGKGTAYLCRGCLTLGCLRRALFAFVAVKNDLANLAAFIGFGALLNAAIAFRPTYFLYGFESCIDGIVNPLFRWLHIASVDVWEWAQY